MSSFCGNRRILKVVSKTDILYISGQGFSESPMSVFCSWKHFCTRYFHNWCKHNSPCGFLVQSSAVIGLVRNNSITLFRDMEKIEVLIDGMIEIQLFEVLKYFSILEHLFLRFLSCMFAILIGSSDELLDHSFGLDICDDDSEREILVDVLRCIISLNQQLGKTASAIFYESLVGTSVISSEEIVPRLLKILETGYSSLVSSVHVSDLGGDFALEKELADHRNLRKFSVNLLFSLHALSRKTDSWGKILDVIETYLQFLVPQKVMQKLDAGMSLHISASILVQAASPIAKSMFDSAFDILLFVSYLLNVSGQVSFFRPFMTFSCILSFDGNSLILFLLLCLLSPPNLLFLSVLVLICGAYKANESVLCLKN